MGRLPEDVRLQGELVGRRMKRGSGDRDERVPAKPSPHIFANIPVFSQR